MVSQDPTAVIILSEMIFIETMIIIVIATYCIYRKKMKTKQLIKLIDEHGNSESERKSSLNETVSKLPNLNESDVTDLVEKIMSHENNYFKYVINTFSQNNVEDINNLGIELKTLVVPYVELIQKHASSLDNGKNKTIPAKDITIDELLGDNEESIEGDPALDLSEPVDEIEEIPDEFLSRDLDIDNGYAESLKKDED